MPVDCSAFSRAGHSISASDFRTDFEACHDRAIESLEDELLSIEVTKINLVRKLRLHGAVLSNPHMRNRMLEGIERIRITMKEKGISADFTVDSLPTNIAE